MIPYGIIFRQVTLDARTHAQPWAEGGPSSTNQNRIFSLALNNNNMDHGGGCGGRRRIIINNRLPRVNRSNVKRERTMAGGKGGGSSWDAGEEERREIRFFFSFRFVIGKNKGIPRGWWWRRWWGQPVRITSFLEFYRVYIIHVGIYVFVCVCNMNVM